MAESHRRQKELRWPPLTDKLVVVPSNPVGIDAQGNLSGLVPKGQSSGEGRLEVGSNQGDPSGSRRLTCSRNVERLRLDQGKPHHKPGVAGC